MVIELRHVEKAGPTFPDLPPLSWDYWNWGASEPYKRTAIASCDQGHVSTANPAIHTIAEDGTLSPSWVCPYTGCTWHVFARLVGWEPLASGGEG